MADVDDRGQLMLVGALTLAVMFVALAVLLNAAIYTGNVATRDAGPGTGEAIEYEGEATAMSRAVLESIHESGSEYAALNEEFNRTVEGWSGAAGTHVTVALADTELAEIDTTRGTRISQSTDRNFTDTEGNPNWIVADDTQSRAFRMNVTRESLVSSDTPIDDGAFRVTFTESGDDDVWKVYLHQEGTDDVSVTVLDPDGNDDTCTVETGERAVIDITAGTVDGEPCPEMRFFGNLSEPYTIRYVDAVDGGDDQVEGTYSVVVDRPRDSLDTGAREGDQPSAVRTLYSAELRVTYRSANVYYQSEFRVAPGEPDA
ncbi:hypothetical protein B4589_002835 [Halolamina sp. CBA1230]|uniref:DUF7261 family protein n=1 Tax=Halolamina sp. CBA1230 TaxID=1853690 RepID=UPI0009A13B44|nr:hypothetical protein [Halolamina sp. CBA1230]QKY19361.1 hypothetical protein B4589_002835 [Halolamina sp. CBA1230]